MTSAFNSSLTEVKWKDVRVGDVLKLKNDEFVTVCFIVVYSVCVSWHQSNIPPWHLSGGPSVAVIQ